MKADYDLIIVGGGIVGLATALRTLERRPDMRLLLLEKESHLAMHQTGHNSGVIHSGLYYKPGSLKARNCIEGYQQLIEFCKQESIPHEICGKIVVATCEDELPWLDELYNRGVANGLMGLKSLSPEEIKEKEPCCSGIRGLYVPQTGIVDYSLVAKKYAEKIILFGGDIYCENKVLNILQSSDLVEVFTVDQKFTCKKVVTCAGLHSDRVAKYTTPDLNLRITPFRGEYYKLKPSAHNMVRNLIYPVPNPDFPFLGVHFTRLINGDIECGPNAVLALSREGYSKTCFSIIDTLDIILWRGFRKIAVKYWYAGMMELYRSFSKKAFVKALQKLIPDIHADMLESGGAGVRAQACSYDGALLDDFYISENGRAINVCNAPSPAATASLSIGKSVAARVLAKL